MSEEWIPISGYEGIYEVSSLGRVRSLDRVIQRQDRGKRPGVKTARYKGRIRKQPLDSGGYPSVNLCRDGTCKLHLVHQLVCRAFHGPRPEGKEAGHRNGIRTDCCEDNLRWVTKLENAADRKLHEQERAQKKEAA